MNISTELGTPQTATCTVVDGTEDLLHTVAHRATSAIYLIALSIIGSAGHVATAYDIHRGRQNGKSNWSAMLINLSVVGLITNSFVLPIYSAHIILGGVVLGETGCLILSYINYSLILSQLSNCVVIAMLKCILLTRPQQMNSKKYKYIIIGSLWIVPFICGILGFEHYGFSDNQLHCIFKDTEGQNWYVWAMIALPCVIALIAISTCYVLICRTVRQSRKQMQKHKKVEALRMWRIKCERRVSMSAPAMSQSETGSDRQPCGPPERPSRLSVSQQSLPAHVTLTAWSDPNSKAMRLTIKLVINFTVFIVLWSPITALYFVDGTYYIDPAMWLSFSVLARTYTAIDWMIYGRLQISCGSEQAGKTKRNCCLLSNPHCCCRDTRVVPQT